MLETGKRFLPRQAPAFEAARHPAVSVPEGMDQNEVEVSHRGFDDDGDIAIGFQVGDEFVRMRASTESTSMPSDDFAGLFFLDIDGAPRATGRAALQVVVRHHEVKALDELLFETEPGLFGKLRT